MLKIEKKISFVIPCYYSQDTVSDVVRDIFTEFPREDYNIEIVLVNDGSKDNTYNVLKSLADQDSRVVVINLSRNFGQDGATMCGFTHATGDYIVALDDDGQNPPCEAHKLLEEIEKGYDIVFAKYHEKKDSAFKKFGHNLNGYIATTLIGKPKDIELNSYFVITSFVRDQMIKYQGAYPYIWGLMLRATDNMANVYVEHKAREVGESTYTLRKLVGLWFDGVISFSIKPLRITSVLGVVATILGFLLAIVIIIKTLIYGDVAGWTSLIATILILSGVQMLMLGMLGEYVGRNFLNNNNSPQYIVRDKYIKEQD
ncbi:glycosyltransferase family 2 protein [Pseudobutyrivibrio xylanivorans]|uniref:Undecaprenyl-phosphate 4-deoxy-4-formamido-L-arabinose transferase n=1 Tax=Pseudobutyrivibrio xylanivorans DSM 14809 TaxID=1123012 RepID=A0A1M6GVI8_PSEXY|nr:glycosyltransferase family 2 protein [Pseudobutyrivibrio xylanivorans]SHJ13993.1 undecaprenyl-phosphate 4-deoxy-4-formamido-L-arabinose transferase [Pseudobutyrivibrio xylanivorans DSM 14809]